MAWFCLLIAGILQCGWAVGMKYTDGFTRPVPSILTITAMGVSFWFLSVAMRTIPLGTAYAVWTGIGAVGCARIKMASVSFSAPRGALCLDCLFDMKYVFYPFGQSL